MEVEIAAARSGDSRTKNSLQLEEKYDQLYGCHSATTRGLLVPGLREEKGGDSTSRTVRDGRKSERKIK